jgi:glycosyltransferase involved in cell wall biosynthesis
MVRIRKRILLLGKTAGTYRTQNLIKALLDERYILSIASTEWYSKPREAYSSHFDKIKGRFLNKIFNILILIETLIRGSTADLIYILPMNSDMINTALRVKRLHGTPIISELYISLYDTLVHDRKKLKDNTGRSEYLKHLDKMLIEKSDYLVHLSNHEFNYISKLVGANIDPDRLKIFPLAIEEKLVADTIIEDSENIFRMCWWGHFSPLHGLEKIFIATKILKSQGHKIRLDIWGPTDFSDPYVEMAKEMGLSEEISFHGSDYSTKLQEYLTHYCDLALGIFGDSGKAQNAVANKVVDAMAMRLPVLTMDSPCLWEFFEPTDIFACSNEPEEMARKIVEIAANRENLKKTAFAGHVRYLETFTVKQYSKKVLELVKNVIESKQTQEKNGATDLGYPPGVDSARY